MPPPRPPSAIELRTTSDKALGGSFKKNPPRSPALSPTSPPMLIDNPLGSMEDSDDAVRHKAMFLNTRLRTMFLMGGMTAPLMGLLAIVKRHEDNRQGEKLAWMSLLFWMFVRAGEASAMKKGKDE
jgi:hypothetical protein